MTDNRHPEPSLDVQAHIILTHALMDPREQARVINALVALVTTARARTGHSMTMEEMHRIETLRTEAWGMLPESVRTAIVRWERSLVGLDPDQVTVGE